MFLLKTLACFCLHFEKLGFVAAWKIIIEINDDHSFQYGFPIKYLKNITVTVFTW